MATVPTDGQREPRADRPVVDPWDMLRRTVESLGDEDRSEGEELITYALEALGEAVQLDPDLRKLEGMLYRINDKCEHYRDLVKKDGPLKDFDPADFDSDTQRHGPWGLHDFYSEKKIIYGMDEYGQNYAFDGDGWTIDDRLLIFLTFQTRIKTVCEKIITAELRKHRNEIYWILRDSEIGTSLTPIFKKLFKASKINTSLPEGRLEDMNTVMQLRQNEDKVDDHGLVVQPKQRSQDELRFSVQQGGRSIGFVDVFLDRKNGLGRIENSHLNTAYRGQGIGGDLYERIHGLLRSRWKVSLASDTDRSEAAEGLWRRLERQGKAEKRDHEVFSNGFYVMK